MPLSTTRQRAATAGLAFLLLLGACSDDDSATPRDDDAATEPAAEATESEKAAPDSEGASPADTTESDRPFDIDRDQLAASLATATVASDVEVDGDVVRLIFDEGSVDSPMAVATCSAANRLKAADDHVVLVYVDGEVDCDETGGN